MTGRKYVPPARKYLERRESVLEDSHMLIPRRSASRLGPAIPRARRLRYAAGCRNAKRNIRRRWSVHWSRRSVRTSLAAERVHADDTAVPVLAPRSRQDQDRAVAVLGARRPAVCAHGGAYGAVLLQPESQGRPPADPPVPGLLPLLPARDAQATRGANRIRRALDRERRGAGDAIDRQVSRDCYCITGMRVPPGTDRAASDQRTTGR